MEVTLISSQWELRTSIEVNPKGIAANSPGFPNPGYGEDKLSINPEGVVSSIEQMGK